MFREGLLCVVDLPLPEPSGGNNEKRGPTRCNYLASKGSFDTALEAFALWAYGQTKLIKASTGLKIVDIILAGAKSMIFGKKLPNERNRRSGAVNRTAQLSC